MNLIYVDESGDDGISQLNIYTPKTTPSHFFIRTALIIHDKKWQSNHENINKLRMHLKAPKEVEIHAADIMRGKTKK